MLRVWNQRAFFKKSLRKDREKQENVMKTTKKVDTIERERGSTEPGCAF